MAAAHDKRTATADHNTEEAGDHEYDHDDHTAACHNEHDHNSAAANDDPDRTATADDDRAAVDDHRHDHCAAAGDHNAADNERS